MQLLRKDNVMHMLSAKETTQVANYTLGTSKLNKCKNLTIIFHERIYDTEIQINT